MLGMCIIQRFLLLKTLKDICSESGRGRNVSSASSILGSPASPALLLLEAARALGLDRRLQAEQLSPTPGRNTEEPSWDPLCSPPDARTERSTGARRYRAQTAGSPPALPLARSPEEGNGNPLLPTPVFLPGEVYGQRSLAGNNPRVTKLRTRPKFQFFSIQAGRPQAQGLTFVGSSSSAVKWV